MSYLHIYRFPKHLLEHVPPLFSVMFPDLLLFLLRTMTPYNKQQTTNNNTLSHTQLKTNQVFDFPSFQLLSGAGLVLLVAWK